MTSPGGDRFKSLKKSWAPISPQTNTTTRKITSTEMSSPPSNGTNAAAATVPMTATSSAPSPRTREANALSPRRGASPTRTRFQATSPRGSPSMPKDAPKDALTEVLGVGREMDGRCSAVVGDRVWVGERSGDVTIRNVDGDVVHIVEKRKGVFVWSMIYVPSCNAVWCGCSDGFVRVINGTNYHMEKQFAKHAGGGGGVHALAYHSPSNTVFSGSNDFEIQVWNVSTGEYIRQYAMQSGVRAIALLPTIMFAAADDGSISVWDLIKGDRKCVLSGHSRSVLCLAITELHLWSGSEDGTIRIWDINTFDCIGVVEVHTGAVKSLETIGLKVWSGSGDTICLWDSEKLKLLGTYVAHDGHVDTITAVHKEASYKVWTSGSNKELKIWRSQSIPDETVLLKSKLERLQGADYERGLLRERVHALEVELERRNNVDAENESLRQENAGLAAELNVASERVRQLLAEVGSLTSKNDELFADNGRLKTELARALTMVSSLESTLSERDETIHNLSSTIVEKSRQIQNQREEIAGLQHTVEDLRADRGQLSAELDHRRREVAELSELSAALRIELDNSAAENTRLISDLNDTRGDLDAMAFKLKEMDTIFKSRLSLVTDMFKVYKKVEYCDRRLRSANQEVRDATTDSMIAFKQAVSMHYTDDELAHLGSSRHFFPRTTTATTTTAAAALNSPNSNNNNNNS